MCFNKESDIYAALKIIFYLNKGSPPEQVEKIYIFLQKKAAIGNTISVSLYQKMVFKYPGRIVAIGNYDSSG